MYSSKSVIRYGLLSRLTASIRLLKPSLPVTRLLRFRISPKRNFNNADSSLVRKKSELGDLTSLVKMFVTSSIQKPVVEEKPKIVTSPQTKRKAKAEEEPDDLCETNNKAFTNQLRKGIQKISFDNGEPEDKPVGYYADKFPDELIELKHYLGKFVPVDWTFKDSWRKANAALCQERCNKKTKI